VWKTAVEIFYKLPVIKILD